MMCTQQTVYSLQVCTLEDVHSSGSHVHLSGAHVYIISAHVHIISARANVHIISARAHVHIISAHAHVRSAHVHLLCSKCSSTSVVGQGNFRGLEALRPRTSKCVVEAKDVVKDSTSGNKLLVPNKRQVNKPFTVFRLPVCMPDTIICQFALLIIGSNYFTENFQVKENKTKMRNIHLRFFHLLF